MAAIPQEHPRENWSLDEEAAGAVNAHLANRVLTWESLQDAGTIEDWVFEEFYRQAGEVEGREVVADEDVATISRKVGRALRGVVKSGRVEAGKVVMRPTVPRPFLSEAPLVEGRWIDAVVVELAELGAILRDDGYETRETMDDHALAWDEAGRYGKERNWQGIDGSSWRKARSPRHSLPV